MNSYHLSLLEFVPKSYDSLLSSLAKLDGCNRLYLNESDIIISGKSDFQYLYPLGIGQFGVAAWEHIQTRMKFAVKIVPIPLNSYPSNSQKCIKLNLEREIYTLKNVAANSCNYIVNFYGFGIFEYNCHLFMEIMDINLHDLYRLVIEVHKFPEELIGFVNAAVINGLCHLHDLGCVHRDIKPDNVLLKWNGQIKIADFGLTREQVSSRPKSLVGTVCYQAPELFVKRDYTNDRLNYEYDDRVDSWSLGIMLTELAFGAHPYSPYINNTWNLFVVADCIEKLDTNKMIELCLSNYSELFKSYIGKCLQKNFIIRAHCSDLKNSKFYQQYATVLSPEVVGEYLKSYQDLAQYLKQAQRCDERMHSSSNRFRRAKAIKSVRFVSAIKSHVDLCSNDLKDECKWRQEITEIAEQALDKTVKKKEYCKRRHEILAKLIIKPLKVSLSKLMEEEMGGFLEVTRFEDYTNNWACAGEPDSISFKINIPLTLCGIKLYGPCEENIGEVEYIAEIDLHEEETGCHIAIDAQSYICENSNKSYRIDFLIPFTITPNFVYSITARIKGPTSFKGIYGKDEMERKLSNGKSIKIQFLNTHGKINTGVRWGQIPTLIFAM